MEKEGRSTIVSREASAQIDHNLAMEFKKIKAEFERKESNSRAVMRGKIIK